MDAPNAAITFVDLAGFTALTEAHGDREAADLAQRFAELAADTAAAGDRLVKSIGDAVLLASDDAPSGLRHAVALMRRCAAEPGFPLPRGGIHVGPVVHRGHDVFGATVNVAARVAAQAHGSQLLMTAAVRAAVDPIDGLVDLGEFELRNVSEPVQLFDHPLGLDHGIAGVDPVCRMRVERDQAAGRLRHDGVDHWFCSLRCAAMFASAPDQHRS